MAHEQQQGGIAAPSHQAVSEHLHGRPLIVGEVLFDVFEDGSRVLGGAPFNVAWHLQAFGMRPIVVTRIGNDELGGEILEAMDGWGMDRLGVQVDSEAPTGRVRVDLEQGTPTFSILPDQAYDRLDADVAIDAVAGKQLSLVYHGSLIARSPSSRRTVEKIRERCLAPAFVDVNLRDPWWSESTVASLLTGARWVKLNHDELLRLTDGGSDAPGENLGEQAAELGERHALSEVVVTRGENGALAWSRQGIATGRPPRSVDVVDTVGAGDAFSAVWIIGRILGWPVRMTLDRALDFAAVYCGVRGATVGDRGLYSNQMRLWEDQ